MDIKELRIGNLVRLEEGEETEQQVDYLNADSECVGLFGNAIINSITDIEGIPLTDKWVIRMGFKKVDYPVYVMYVISVGDFELEYRIHKKRGSIELYLVGNGLYDERGETDLTDICKYVHSLQNVYFALTGKELQIAD